MSLITDTAWVIASSAWAALAACCTLSSVRLWLSSITRTTSRVPCCNCWIMVWISSVAFWVFCARLRTSSATTAKPRPCSPARAASMAAFKASRLVCSAMPRMAVRMALMFSLSLASACTTFTALPISTASTPIEFDVSCTICLPWAADWSA
ncbi:hypothetical protein D3C73_998360 [compost metagenome]